MFKAGDVVRDKINLCYQVIGNFNDHTLLALNIFGGKAFLNTSHFYLADKKERHTFLIHLHGNFPG